MATGYTAGVEDGTVTDFATFALICARAFGATIMQREDPLSEPPKHREPTDYNAMRLEVARAELRTLNNLTMAEARRRAEADYAEALEQYRESLARAERESARYQAMRESVLAWEPPTADHHGLKDFMLEQLERGQSSYRPTHPEKLDAMQWLERERKRVEWDLSYNAKSHEEELTRCASANAWIDALYASLSPVSSPTR